MEATARMSFVRISPRKAQIVADLIRGKDASAARAILMQTPKSASEYLLKLLNSACANAENNHEMDVDRLYVSYAHVGPGPIMKRIQPVSKGRANRINKRTSHLTITVSERE